MKSNRVFVIALSAILLGFVVLLAASQMGWFKDKPLAAPNLDFSDPAKPDRVVEHKPLADALGVSEQDMVEVGGIKRPKRDLAKDTADLIAARKKYQALVPNPGRAPYVPADTNAHTAKLSEELKASIGKSPAKSTYYGAEPFDRDAYVKDPAAYLTLTRPARVFQSAQPSEDVDPISSNTEFYQEILQGESVVLEVKAEPKMPVTFHTQQLGEFDNRLKTITVEASEEGIARASYRAVSGVAGLINVMAASPVNSGQLKYIINVNLPE